VLAAHHRNGRRRPPPHSSPPSPPRHLTSCLPCLLDAALLPEIWRRDVEQLCCSTRRCAAGRWKNSTSSCAGARRSHAAQLLADIVSRYSQIERHAARRQSSAPPLPLAGSATRGRRAVLLDGRAMLPLADAGRPWSFIGPDCLFFFFLGHDCFLFSVQALDCFFFQSKDFCVKISILSSPSLPNNI
jgi:hypothetical protein